MMTKVEEFKNKIKELNDSSEKLKNEVLSISKEVEQLKDKLYIEEHKEFYEGVKKLNGSYFQYENSTDTYRTVWYVHIKEVAEPENNGEHIVEVKGTSVCLTFVNDCGERGRLVTYTYDVESSYGITLDWDDSYAGYFKLNNIKPLTEDGFNLAKDMIKYLN